MTLLIAISPSLPTLFCHCGIYPNPVSGTGQALVIPAKSLPRIGIGAGIHLPRHCGENRNPPSTSFPRKACPAVDPGPESTFHVIPPKGGIQSNFKWLRFLDSGFRRNDGGSREACAPQLPFSLRSATTGETPNDPLLPSVHYQSRGGRRGD